MIYENHPSIDSRRTAIKVVSANNFFDSFKKLVYIDPEGLIDWSNKFLHTYWNIFGIVDKDEGHISWFTKAKIFDDKNKTNTIENEDRIINQFKEIFGTDSSNLKFVGMYASGTNYNDYKKSFNEFTEEEFRLMLRVHRHKISTTGRDIGFFKLSKPIKSPLSNALKILDALRGTGNNEVKKLESLILNAVGFNENEKKELINYEAKFKYLNDQVTEQNVEGQIAVLQEPINQLLNNNGLDYAINFCIKHKTGFRMMELDSDVYKEKKVSEQILKFYSDKLQELINKLAKKGEDMKSSLNILLGDDKAEFKEIMNDNTKLEEFLNKRIDEMFSSGELKENLKDQKKNFENDKIEYDNCKSEIDEIKENARREVSILTFLEELLFFKPRVLLSAGTIDKLISVYKAVDSIINNSLIDPGNVEKYVIDGLSGLGIKVSDNEAVTKQLKQLEDRRKYLIDNPLDDAVLDNQMKQSIDDRIIELNSQLNKGLIDEIKAEVFKIKQPIDRGEAYKALNNLLIQADPSRVNELIDDKFKLKGLKLIQDDGENNENLRQGFKGLLPDGIPEQAVDTAIKEVKDYLAMMKLPINSLIKLLSLAV